MYIYEVNITLINPRISAKQFYCKISTIILEIQFKINFFSFIASYLISLMVFNF